MLSNVDGENLIEDSSGMDLVEDTDRLKEDIDPPEDFMEDGVTMDPLANFDPLEDSREDDIGITFGDDFDMGPVVGIDSLEECNENDIDMDRLDEMDPLEDFIDSADVELINPGMPFSFFLYLTDSCLFDFSSFLCVPSGLLMFFFPSD